MRRFDVQTVDLGVPYERAFRYVSDPRRLPEWTHAFAAVRGDTATMRTPTGAVEVRLQVAASEEHGTIDWTIVFPTGEIASASSRLVRAGDRSLYTFVLQPPPGPLERLEGTLAEQSRVLADELATLQRRLNG
jgi:hypothetical protein